MVQWDRGSSGAEGAVEQWGMRELVIRETHVQRELAYESLCVVRNEPVTRKAWKIGNSPDLNPRLLHSIDSIVLLVSCQYVCQKNHIFLTTDPRLLHLIYSKHIPFVLLHKTGFLKTLVRHVVRLIREGMSISAVERFICHLRKSNFSIKYKQYANILSLSPDDLSHNAFISLLQKPYPSNDIICKCFIAEVFLCRAMYASSMSSIFAKDVITFDHTFKVAANIGYLRSDGKWTTQYNSVFIVMNKEGQVITWQFTKTSSMCI